MTFNPPFLASNNSAYASAGEGGREGGMADGQPLFLPSGGGGEEGEEKVWLQFPLCFHSLLGQEKSGSVYTNSPKNQRRTEKVEKLGRKLNSASSTETNTASLAFFPKRK